MEEFGANLADGESWIPSDIFPNGEQPPPPPPHGHHNRPTTVVVAATSMEDLNRQFNNCNILDHHLLFNSSVSQVIFFLLFHFFYCF